MDQEMARTQMLLGEDNLERLKKARVVLLGLGGVGGHCFEALVRGGLGRLDVVDGDIFTMSNLNRQLLATYENIGTSKVAAAVKRAGSINRHCRVVPHETFLTADNLEEILGERPDYVIDAIDTVTTKLEVIAYCKARGIPVISSMGTGNKLDPSKLVVTDLSKTIMCPLSKVMRRELRKRGIRSVQVVASTEKPLKPLEVTEDGLEIQSKLRKRSTPGSNSFVPPAAGLLLAATVLRALVVLPSLGEDV